jgi:hypothetical protein
MSLGGSNSVAMAVCVCGCARMPLSGCERGIACMCGCVEVTFAHNECVGAARFRAPTHVSFHVGQLAEGIPLGGGVGV